MSASARPTQQQVSDELMRYIGRRMQERIRELGISQSELARMIGHNRSYVSRAISRASRGELMTIMQLAKLADVLHLRIELRLSSTATRRSDAGNP